MRVWSRSKLERMDRRLDAAWNGRLDTEARAARLEMSQCQLVLIGWSAVYGAAIVTVAATQGLGGWFAATATACLVLPLPVLRTFARADRRMSAALAASNGLPVELGHLLDRRNGWARLDASVAMVRSIVEDSAVPAPGGGWRPREARIARIWGHRLDAVGVHGVWVRSRWLGMMLTAALVILLVMPFIDGRGAQAAALLAAAVVVLATLRMHAWARVIRASAARALGLPTKAPQMLPLLVTSLTRFDAAVERARAGTTEPARTVPSR